MSLLVVEDSDTDYQALSEALAARTDVRYELGRARTRQEAIALLGARRFDAALFDLTLPDSQGLDGLKLFLEVARALPVIVLTDRNAEEEGARAVGAGAQDHLGKERYDGALIGRSIRYSIERHRLLEQQRKLQEQANLSQKLDVVSTLSAGLAHDLSNILTPVIMSAELGLASCQDSALSELFTDIRVSALWASDLAQQLMALSRDTRSQELDIVDAGETIDRAVKQIRKTLPREIELVVEGGCKGQPILAGATDIQQLLFNLCINASQAIGNGASGRIVIAVARRQARFEQSERAAEEALSVTVRDSGPGFPTKDLANVFEPFFSTKKKPDGAGLGLAVCQGIARRLGGRISARNAPQGGAEVEFLIPLSGDGSLERFNYESLQALRGDDAIAVVDEDERVTTRTGQLLSYLGYRVDCFANAKLALESLESDWKGYNLVVLDYALSELPALRLAEAIQLADPLARIAIATAHREALIALVGDGLAKFQLLSKPYGAKDIVEILKSSSAAT